MAWLQTPLRYLADLHRNPWTYGAKMLGNSICSVLLCSAGLCIGMAYIGVRGEMALGHCDRCVARFDHCLDYVGQSLVETIYA